MNQGFVYVDGKAIISDESGNQEVVDYYDNLTDILVQENVVETMENRIAELEKGSQNSKRKHYIPFVIPVVLLCSTVGLNWMFRFIAGRSLFAYSVPTMFGMVSEGVCLNAIVTAILLPLAAVGEVTLYREYKKEKRIKKEKISELEFLQKQIVEEKRVLEDLKREKKKEEKIAVRVVEVDENELKNDTSFSVDLGYYEENQQGSWNDELGNHSAETNTEIAQGDLEEKGPVLVKIKPIQLCGRKNLPK